MISSLTPRNSSRYLNISPAYKLFSFIRYIPVWVISFLLNWIELFPLQSSGSVNESGIQSHRSTKSKSADESDDNSSSDEENDNASISLEARDGSDNGSGTQVFIKKSSIWDLFLALIFCSHLCLRHIWNCFFSWSHLLGICLNVLPCRI